MTEPAASPLAHLPLDLVADESLSDRAFADALQSALAAGANIEARDARGRTPLLAAVEAGLSELKIAALIEAGADVGARGAHQNTSMHIAAEVGHADAIALLAGARADVNAENAFGYTPAHRAALGGRADALATLALHQADLLARDSRGRDAMALATGDTPAPQPAIVGALIRLGLPVDSLAASGESVMQWAAARGMAGRVAALAGDEGRARIAEHLREAQASGKGLSGRREVDFTDASGDGQGGLHEAARHGRVDAIGFFLAQGMGSSVRDNSDQSPMMLAAGSAAPTAPEFIATLAAAGGRLDDMGEKRSRMSPLMIASQKGLTRNAVALLRAGATADLAGAEDGFTAADYAAVAGRAETLDALIGFGANAGPRGEGKDWPLTHAARSGRAEACELLARRYGVDVPGHGGSTALALAALSGARSAAETLLWAGADIDAVDARGRPPIVHAAHGNKGEMAALLASRGAKVDLCGPGGASALSIFAGRGNVEACAALLRFGADPNLADAKGITPLAQAALARSGAIVRDMLANGGDPSIPDHAGYTPALLAAETEGAEWVLADMAEGGRDLGPPGPDGRSVLVRALSSTEPTEASPGKRPCGFATAKKLLACGQSPVLGGVDGVEPLHLAAAAGNGDLIEVFIAGGANVDTRDGNGFTPLMRAAMAGRGRSVERLLDHGADPSLRANAGATALHMARMAGEEGTGQKAGARAAQRALIYALADVDEIDFSGRSQLHWAARYHQPAFVDLLLSRGANPNLVSREGARPLEVALLAADHETPLDDPLDLSAIDSLLKAGADAKALDARGHSMLELAGWHRWRRPAEGSPFASSAEALCAKLIAAGAPVEGEAVAAALAHARVNVAVVREIMAAEAAKAAQAAPGATPGVTSGPAQAGATPPASPTPRRPGAGPAL